MNAYDLVKKRLTAIRNDIAENETHNHLNAQFITAQNIIAEYLEQLLKDIAELEEK